MRKLILLTVTLGTGLMLWPQTPAARVPDATLGAQTVGRMAIFPDGTTELYGYYTFVQGIGAEGGAALFNGAVSTRNARFTFRTERSAVDFISNGILTHVIARPLSSLGTLVSVYFDPTPEQDFSRPESFSDGERIATYRVRGTRATIAFGAGAMGSLTMTLESARDFTVNDATFNLSRLGDQLAVNIASSTPASLEEFFSLRNDGGLTVSFGGTAYTGFTRQ